MNKVEKIKAILKRHGGVAKERTRHNHDGEPFNFDYFYCYLWDDEDDFDAALDEIEDKLGRIIFHVSRDFVGGIFESRFELSI